jgi:hypothetical protein
MRHEVGKLHDLSERKRIALAAAPRRPLFSNPSCICRVLEVFSMLHATRHFTLIATGIRFNAALMI